MGQWLVEKFLGVFSDRRHLRVGVHRAHFSATGQDAFFINVTNLSRNREVEITHVYFDLRPQVHATHPSRSLPKRLKPDETWETWVEADRLPADLGRRLFELARVRLSTGGVVKGKESKNVPSEGTVPGGPVGQG